MMFIVYKPVDGRPSSTHHIDTTVARNSNDAVERTQINAHNRHVYTGSRGIGKMERGGIKRGGKKSFV